MKKIAVAVIKNNGLLLLTQSALDHKNLGLPGVVVGKGERVSSALKNTLKLKFGIEVNVAKQISSLYFDEYEMHAYDIQSYNNSADIRPYGSSLWVPIQAVFEQKLHSSDKKVIMRITNTKEKQEKPEPQAHVQSFLATKVKSPVFNVETKKWEVFVGKKLHCFDDKEKAMDFYVESAREILGPLFAAPQRTHD